MKIKKTFKKLQNLSINGWVMFLVALVSVGMMIFCLIGCGSESTPKGAASVKGKTSENAGAMKGNKPLLSTKGEGSGEAKKINKGIDPPRIEVVPGFTQWELESRHAEQRKKYEEYKANMEVAPGLTQGEIEARHATQRKKYEEYRANMEVAPGLTRAELEARHEEQRKKFAEAGTQIVPGLTMKQFNAKMKQQVRPEGRELLPPSAGK